MTGEAAGDITPHRVCMCWLSDRIANGVECWAAAFYVLFLEYHSFGFVFMKVVTGA